MSRRRVPKVISPSAQMGQVTLEAVTFSSSCITRLPVMSKTLGRVTRYTPTFVKLYQGLH